MSDIQSEETYTKAAVDPNTSSIASSVSLVEQLHIEQMRIKLVAQKLEAATKITEMLTDVHISNGLSSTDKEALKKLRTILVTQI